jgi:predicted RNA binding protein YcfA (HicA-like mRNA interferase family)
VVRAFERLGFEIKPRRGKGSHTVLARAGSPMLTVPQQNPIKRALLAGLIKDSGHSIDEFKAVL